MIFFTDLVFSFILILLIFYLFFLFLSNSIENKKQLVESVSLERKALTFADGLVKKSIKSNSQGLSVFDDKKHRVLSNIIDFHLIDDKQFPENVKEVFIKFKNGETHFIRQLPLTEKCFSIQRFVLVKEEILKKALLGVVFCE